MKEQMKNDRVGVYAGLLMHMCDSRRGGGMGEAGRASLPESREAQGSRGFRAELPPEGQPAPGYFAAGRDSLTASGPAAAVVLRLPQRSAGEVDATQTRDEHGPGVALLADSRADAVEPLEGDLTTGTFTGAQPISPGNGESQSQHNHKEGLPNDSVYQNSIASSGASLKPLFSGGRGNSDTGRISREGARPGILQDDPGLFEENERLTLLLSRYTTLLAALREENAELRSRDQEASRASQEAARLLAAYQFENQSVMQESTDLTGENERLRRQADAAKARLWRLEEESATAISQFEEQRDRIQALESRLSRAITYSREVTAKLRAFRRESVLQDLNMRLSRYALAEDDLTHRCARKTAEAVGLRTKLSELQAQELSVDGTHSVLTLALSRCSMEAEDARARCGALNRAIFAGRDEIAGLRSELARGEAQRASLNAELGLSRNEAERLSAALQSRTEELDTARATLLEVQGSKSKDSQEIGRLKQELALQTRLAERLQETVSQQAEKMATLTTEAADLRVCQSSHEADARGYQARIDALESELEFHKGRTGRESSELETCRAELKEAQRQAFAAQGRFEASGERERYLQSVISDLKAEKEELGSQLGHARKSLQAKECECEALSERLQRASQSLEEQTQLAKSQESLAVEQSRLCAEERQKCAAALAHEEGRENQIQELADKVKSLAEERERLQAEVQRLSAESSQQREDNANMSVLVEDLAGAQSGDRVYEILRENIKLKRQLETLVQQREEGASDLQAAGAASRTLKDRIDALRGSRDALEAEASRYWYENEQLKKKLYDTAKATSEKVALIGRLRSHVQALECKVATLQREVAMRGRGLQQKEYENARLRARLVSGK